MWAATEQLLAADQVGGFSCGRPSVDNWLHAKALAARPHVDTQLYLDNDGIAVAFAATTMAVVDITGGSSAQRYGHREGKSVGFMLAQMGVRHDRAGRGIGGAVVQDTLNRAVTAYQQAPFPLFVVDAADETLVSYYQQFGFKPIKGSLRLLAQMRKIVKTPS